jgi:hypothetical protein
MPRRSVVMEIRKKQKAGIKITIICRKDAPSLDEHLKKIREDARASERLTAADFMVTCH